MQISCDVVFVVGPTAAGKSDLALDLAKELDGEIVSCDSMQVYREINILSAKPSKDQRRAVTHHLIDVASIRDTFDAVRLNRLARSAITGILDRGRHPIVVGGSGLYLKVLLDGIREAGKPDPFYRESLLARLEREGLDSLVGQLKRENPDAAERIELKNPRRVIRALELARAGETRESGGLTAEHDVRVIGLTRPREELYERINRRVDAMIEEGALEEISGLAEETWSPTAAALIGVRELLDVHAGRSALPDAAEKIRKRTRNFAKRQLTWFRKEPRLRWIDATNNDNRARLTEHALRILQSS